MYILCIEIYLLLTSSVSIRFLSALYEHKDQLGA